MRVPVSSKALVSIFSIINSLSRKRTKTCDGTATRAISDTVSLAPGPEPLHSTFRTAVSHTHSCCTGLDSTSDWGGWPPSRADRRHWQHVVSISSSSLTAGMVILAIARCHRIGVRGRQQIDEEPVGAGNAFGEL